MVTKTLFAILLAAVAVQRLLELRKSRRQVAALLKRGGKEHASKHFVAMVLVHVMWFVSMVVEVYVVGREAMWPLFVVGAIMMLAGNTLRFLSMKALGDRWTVRIITLPNAKPITTGIYKRFRHPIYLGVVLEIAGIPLLHSAYITSLVFSILNGLVLQFRIREEEKALRSEGGYDEAFRR